MIDLLNDAQKGTILGRINEVYQNKDFTDSTLEPVGPGETVIGVLTDYEKAIFSVSSSIAEKIESTTEDQKQNNVDYKYQSIIDHNSIDALYYLFWLMVKERIGKKSTEQKNLLIREGWQVTSSAEKEDDDLFSLFGLICL